MEMEGGQFPGSKESVSYWLTHVEEDEEMALRAIPQPETPTEPMEFLSRSWSASANEISKALARKQMQPAFDSNLRVIPETSIAQHPPGKVMKPVNGRTRAGAIGRLFHYKECTDSSGAKKKDKARIENAHTHAVLSVAGLAAALAATTAASTENSEDLSSKTNIAVASATQLLATYCIELAESVGADRERVASVVRSAVGVCSASQLLTLTASAATAMRGEAALKARLPKETRRSAAVSPHERAVVDSPHSPAAEVEEEDFPCVGDLLQLTGKGALRWKHVSVYISKACQVTIKLKSKHVGGNFSKNNISTVYEVIDETGRWPFRKERENVEVYFGVKTAQGLLEFKSKTRFHKQKWVHGIQKLLQRRRRFEEAHNSLRMLNINKSI